MKNKIWITKGVLSKLGKEFVQSAFIALILFCCLTNSVFAQAEKYKTEKIENKIEFQGNIESVWMYLSNLGNLQNLVPSTIDKSVLVGNGKGAIVTITLKNNKGTVVEKVLKLNNKKRIISYTMLSTPMPIKNYIASFIVKQVTENKIEVTFKASFKVQEKNREGRINAFNNLQIELLNNIKKIEDEK